MFRRSSFTSALVLAAGLAAVACGDQESPLRPDLGTRAQSAAEQTGIATGLDDTFMQLAGQVPGFGGYFFDA